MEPVSAAATFATLVSLMADFAASRGHKDVLEIKEFTEWLARHGHSELKEKIEANHQTTVSIKAALSEGRSELLARLERIEGLLATLSIGEGPISDLAASIAPESMLPAQAKAFLVAFETTNAGTALEVQYLSEGTKLHFIDGKGNNSYLPDDPRFLNDDLNLLLKLEMLSLSHNGNGDRLFRITRRGADVARRIRVAESTG
jgi:hypothetical protein